MQPGRQRQRWRVRFVVAIAVCIGLAALRYLLDRPPGGPIQLAWPEPAWAGLRQSAVSAAAIVGLALATAGVLLQTLLRNPLASPYILGLSSGAGLGVTAAAFGAGWLAINAGDAGAVVAGLGSTTLPALAGASAVLAVVYMLGQRRGWIDPLAMVLVGVVISAVCNALIMFLEYLAPAGTVQDIMRWMFGRIPQGLSWTAIGITGSITIAGFALALWKSDALDVSVFGDDEARSLGLHLGLTRFIAFAVSGVLTAVAVAVAGPIGFVGIIAPHAARLLVGPRHRLLLPMSAICGIALVLMAECASQLIVIRSGRLPVGIFTALVGGPLFIWLLRSRRVHL